MAYNSGKRDEASARASRATHEVEAAAPEISVIVPHFNDLANLRNCLDALKAQTFGQPRFEVVVADNMSDCGLDAVRAVGEEFRNCCAGAYSRRRSGAKCGRRGGARGCFGVHRL